MCSPFQSYGHGHKDTSGNSNVANYVTPGTWQKYSLLSLAIKFQQKNNWYKKLENFENRFNSFIPSFKCSKYRRVSKHDIIILKLLLLLQRNEKDNYNLRIIIIQKVFPLLKILWKGFSLCPLKNNLHWYLKLYGITYSREKARIRLSWEDLESKHDVCKYNLENIW